MKKVLSCLILFAAVLSGLIGCSSEQQFMIAQTESVEAAEGIFEVRIATSGWYELCPQDLPARESVIMQDYQLMLGDKIIPTWIVEKTSGDCMQFILEVPEHRYADQLQLQLTETNHPDGHIALNKPESDRNNRLERYQPRAYIIIEENQVYEPLYEDPMPWFWTKVRLDSEALIRLDLSQFVSTPEEIWIELWTKTAGALGPNASFVEHQLDIHANESLILHKQWLGRGKRVLKIPLPANSLNEGAIDLRLAISTDSEIRWDEIYLDKIRLLYRPENATVDDTLGNTRTGRVSSRGWGEVLIAEFVEGYVRNVWHSVPDGGLIPTQSGREYRRYQVEDLKKPQSISRAVNGQIDLAKFVGVEYLAIGPEHLRTTFQPLLDIRNQQDLNAYYVSQEQVFTEYGAGSHHPEAVRQFLSVVRENYSPTLKYVLLIGDPDHNLLSENELQPALASFFTYTLQGGWTASDALFGDLNRDGLPELAIGRLPVNDAAELRGIINKIVRYERQQENLPDDFRIALLIQASDPGILELPTRMAADQQKDRGGAEVHSLSNAEDFTAWLSGGKSGDQIFYFGHGSIQQLSEENILDAGRVQRLKNTRTGAVMYLFTCLAGYFVHPEVDSLAEVMLSEDGSGFVGIYAPTSLALSDDQAPLAAHIFKKMRSGEVPRYGDLFTWDHLAKESITPGLLDVVATMVFFGDPATTFP